MYVDIGIKIVFVSFRLPEGEVYFVAFRCLVFEIYSSAVCKSLSSGPQALPSVIKAPFQNSSVSSFYGLHARVAC